MRTVSSDRASIDYWQDYGAGRQVLAPTHLDAHAADPAQQGDNANGPERCGSQRPVSRGDEQRDHEDRGDGRPQVEDDDEGEGAGENHDLAPPAVGVPPPAFSTASRVRMTRYLQYSTAIRRAPSELACQ